MFDPSREQARRFFFDAWARYRTQQALTDLEKAALEIILLHPEYHPLLDAPERNLDRDFPPEHGETNPFLHLSLHLAIAEQLSIDQPPGISERYHALLARCADAHEARHRLMECLGEMIWQAQRHRTAPDPAVYFGCLDREER